MQHPDEGIIHAWLDGELPAQEVAALESHIAECAECSAKVAEARGLVAASSRIVSALDIVPGGVIPAKGQKGRPWYASTQLRAAAAIVIVAGASALVMRNGGKRAMEDAAMSSAPASAATEIAPRVNPVSEPPVIPPEPLQKKAADETRRASRSTEGSKPQALKAESPPTVQNTAPANDARAERDFAPARERAATAMTGQVSGAAAASPAPPPAPSIALRRAIEPELRKVRSDSTGSNTYTVFKTRDSIEVTLIDAAPVQARVQRTEQSKVLDAPASVIVTGAAAPAAKSKADAQPEVFTITWTDKRGHRMTLRGPVSLTILEQIRSALPPDQR